MSMENLHGRCPNEKNFPHFLNSLLKAEGGTNSVNRKCDPLRRSRVSSARNAGESAICPVRAQPSAEIARVECAKCRRAARVRFGELEDENWRLCSTTWVRRVSGELQDEEEETWRLCSTTLIQGVSGELEDESWRLSSTTLVRGAICGAGRDPRTASTYSDTHTNRDSYTHRHRYTHRDPHTASTHST